MIPTIAWPFLVASILLNLAIYWYVRRRKRAVDMLPENDALKLLRGIEAELRKYRRMQGILQAASNENSGMCFRQRDERTGEEYCERCCVRENMEWLGSTKGFEQNRLLLAKYQPVLLSVQNTLDEAEEIKDSNDEVPSELLREVTGVLRLFHQDVRNLRLHAAENKRRDRQAVQDSLVRRMREEEQFVKNVMRRQ